MVYSRGIEHNLTPFWHRALPSLFVIWDECLVLGRFGEPQLHRWTPVTDTHTDTHTSRYSVWDFFVSTWTVCFLWGFCTVCFCVTFPNVYFLCCSLHCTFFCVALFLCGSVHCTFYVQLMFLCGSLYYYFSVWLCKDDCLCGVFCYLPFLCCSVQCTISVWLRAV